MVQEDYVSFKIAKLLKEKGFDETCRAFWKDWDDSIVLCDCNSSHCIQYCTNSILEKYNDCEETNIAAPTLQMAMKWLREKCYCHIVIDYTFKADANLSEEYVSYCYSVENAKTYVQYTHNEWYSTYEETCEAAIKYCLENLI